MQIRRIKTLLPYQVKGWPAKQMILNQYSHVSSKSRMVQLKLLVLLGLRTGRSLLLQQLNESFFYSMAKGKKETSSLPSQQIQKYCIKVGQLYFDK